MATHLDNRFFVRVKDSIISAAIDSFWKTFNLLMSGFGGFYSFIMCRYFKQYCCSFQDSNVWPLASKICYDICVA